MSRRRRALVFLVLALGTAAAAAAIANGYGAGVVRGYGPLRPVVVLRTAVPAGDRLGPQQVSNALEVRRVPARFVPPGALVSPVEALGFAAATRLPAGSYLLAAQLRAERRNSGTSRALGRRRSPVEISVSGSEALLAVGPGGRGGKVDVVITAEPIGSGPGRTYIAADGVPLLGLRSGPEGPGAETSVATLGLTRRQALRLIAAESFARRLTLLAAG